MNSIEYAYKRFATRRFPEITEADVAAIEERLGIRLPEDYREYLLVYNGGYFDEPEIRCEEEDLRGDGLRHLYGINSGLEQLDLGDPSSLDLIEGNDPVGYLPIGYTAMGGLLILVLEEGEGHGSIFLNKAFGDDYYLADSIEDLFDMLHAWEGE